MYWVLTFKLLLYNINNTFFIFFFKKVHVLGVQLISLKLVCSLCLSICYTVMHTSWWIICNLIILSYVAKPPAHLIVSHINDNEAAIRMEWKWCMNYLIILSHKYVSLSLSLSFNLFLWKEQCETLNLPHFLWNSW